MTGKDRFFIAELEERLRWYREEASEEEFDAEEVDAICTLLQKLSPIREPHMGREEAFRNIMRRVEEEDGDAGGSKGIEGIADSGITEAGEKRGLDGADKIEALAGSGRAGGKGTVFEKNEEGEKGSRRKRRDWFGRKGYRAAVLFIAVFGATLLSLNMVTYAREDKSLFKMILEKVGVLEIVKEEEVVELGVERNNEIKTFYDSWAELDSEIKSKIVVPSYLPQEYSLYNIQYLKLNNRSKLMADYYNKGNGHLLIEITLWENEGREYRESALDEEGHILLSEYSDGNTLYYQYEDEYICMVSAVNGFYRISGNIELEEMLKVREGLGDIK